MIQGLRMGTVNLYEAKTSLSALVAKAAQGEETVICKAGKPMARLTALVPPRKKPRKLGQNEMEISYIAPDFDEPAFTEDELDEMGF